MATKNYAAQIIFGAKADSSVASTTSKLKAEMGKVGASLAALKKSQQDIGALRLAGSKFGAAQEWLKGEQARLASVKKEGTKRDVVAAEKAVKKATAELSRQRAGLAALQASATASGIDFRRLAEEEQRLARAADQAQASQQRLQQSLNRRAGIGALWRDLRGSAASAGDAFQTATGRMAKGLGIVAAAAVGAGYAVGQLVTDVIDRNDDLGDTAESLNITTKALAAWRYIAGTSGVSAEKLDAGIAKFSKNLEEGSPKTIAVLNELRLSREKLMQLPVGRQIYAFSDALSKYNGKMEKSVIVQQAMGKGVVKATGALAKSQADKEKLYKDSVESGYNLNNAQLEVIGKTADAFDFLGVTMTGMKNIVGVELVPAFEDLANVASDFIRENKDSLRKWAADLGTTIKTDLIPFIKQGAKSFPEWKKSLLDMVGGVWSALQAVKDFAGGWKGLAEVLVLANFAPVFAAFGPWGIAVGAVAAGLLLIHNNWDSISKKATEWGTVVRDTFDEAATILYTAWKPAFDWLFEQFEWLGKKMDEWVVQPITKAASVVSGLFGSAPTQFGNAGTAPGATFMGMGGFGAVPALPPAGGNVNKTQTNNVNINVSGAGDPRDFALKLRNDFKQKPLFDMNDPLGAH